jgi:DNA-binding LacI/PurR family transcriptional regulator
MSLPGDLSVIALGSHIRTEGSGTRFASYAIPREEMARQATAMLVRRVEGGRAGAVQQLLLPCEPIRGDTLGPAPTSPARTDDRANVPPAPGTPQQPEQ